MPSTSLDLRVNSYKNVFLQIEAIRCVGLSTFSTYISPGAQFKCGQIRDLRESYQIFQQLHLHMSGFTSTMALPITSSSSSCSSAFPSNVVGWSSHTFCTYTICRASLPAREGVHDIANHFTHLPLGPLPESVKRKTVVKVPERKSSAVVWTGRDEWMGAEEEDEEEGEEEGKVDDELIGMQRLTPILSEEQGRRNTRRH